MDKTFAKNILVYCSPHDKTLQSVDANDLAYAKSDLLRMASEKMSMDEPYMVVFHQSVVRDLPGNRIISQILLNVRDIPFARE